MDFSGKSPETVRSLVAAFDEECPGLMNRLREAVGNSDGDAMKLAAHTLCGALGALCASSAADAAGRVEELARSGELSLATAALSQLEAEIDRLQPGLQAIRDE